MSILFFCPLGERDVIQRDNPNATVIEYSGIALNDAIERMIIYSGYKVEPYGTYGWGRDSDFLRVSDDNKELDKILEKEGYPNLVGMFGPALHSETKYMARRMWKREYEAIINLIEYCKQNGIEMPDEIVEMLLVYNGAYAVPGNLEVSIDSYKEFVVPILKKYGYSVDDDFFAGIDMNASGMKMINHYPDPTTCMMIPCISCPDWEVELRRRTIKLIKEKKYGSDDKKHVM